MNYKTFSEFWSEFLQVTFHLGNPERWSARDKRSDWIKHNLSLQQGRILNLGCGDGLLDIWLSRKGFDMTSVDRVESVLELARKEDDTKRVQFLAEDIRNLNFAAASFDAILILETCGLLNEKEEADLIKKCFSWLKPRGKMILDCPEVVEKSNSWSKEFPFGKVHCKSYFDSSSKIQRIEHTFQEPSGNIFGLFDPIRDQLPGISRYIYTKGELISLMMNAGFVVNEIREHYYPKNYFALVGFKPDSKQ